MSVTLNNKRVEITEDSKDLYVGSGIQGFNATYALDIVETRKKQVFVHCDNERELSEDEAFVIVQEAAESGLLNLEDATTVRIVVE